MLWRLLCCLRFYWLAFLLLSLQAIEDEGGNPDEIEVISEGNKKMPKRPSKGMEPLGHCVSVIDALWVQSLQEALPTVPSCIGPERAVGMD